MRVFAERLKELRGPESQSSFAAAIGIHRVQYVNYEAGKNAPSIEVLERICRVHACSADWLLGLKDRNDSISVHAGDCSAVAIGSNAKASVSAKQPTDCRICPYKKWGENLRKQGLVIPGL